MLGHVDHAQAGRIRGENVDAAGAGTIDIALAIKLHAVGAARPLPDQFRPHPTIRQCPILLHVEHPDVQAGRIIDEEPAFIERKAETIGLVKVIDQQRQGPRIRVEAVHALEIKLARAIKAHAGVDAAVGRVAEINRAIRFHDHIVGAVQLLALEVRGQDFVAAAVQIRATEAAAGVLAGEDAALMVVGIAVGLAARLPKLNQALFLAPAVHCVGGDVGKGEMALKRMPDRAFRKLEAGGELFEFSIRWDEVQKAGVTNFEGHGEQK